MSHWDASSIIPTSNLNPSTMEFGTDKFVHKTTGNMSVNFFIFVVLISISSRSVLSKIQYNFI